MSDAATLSPPAAAPAKSLDHLDVIVECDGLTCYREVIPEHDEITVEEIVAAMKTDSDFLNPLVDRGELRVKRGKHLVVLGHYDGGIHDDVYGDITEVTVYFDDNTSEKISA